MTWLGWEYALAGIADGLGRTWAGAGQVPKSMMNRERNRLPPWVPEAKEGSVLPRGKQASLLFSMGFADNSGWAPLA